MPGCPSQSHLTKMLGLADHFQLMEKNPDVQTIYFDGDKKPDIWRNKRYLYLYANFIQPEIVSNKEMYLLEVIPNPVPKYAIGNVIKNRKLIYHKLSNLLLNSHLVLYLKDKATMRRKMTRRLPRKWMHPHRDVARCSTTKW